MRHTAKRKTILLSFMESASMEGKNSEIMYQKFMFGICFHIRNDYLTYYLAGKYITPWI